MADANDVCAHCGGSKDIRNPSGACDHLYWPDLLSYDARLANGFEPTRDQIIERQQQVIDLLMKAVEPFADQAICWPEKSDDDVLSTCDEEGSVAGYNFQVLDLRRAREAKVEAERILSPREKTDD